MKRKDILHLILNDLDYCENCQCVEGSTKTITIEEYEKLVS